MKTKILNSIMLCFLVIAFFSSCTKEGAMGPQGQTGPQGPSGPSAKYYDFNLLFSSSTSSDSYVLPSSLDAGDIVIVYYDDGNFKHILPYNDYVGLGSSFPEMANLTFDVGSITIFIKNKTPFTYLHYINFRAVVISAAHRLTNPNINLKNYADLKTYFNLKD